MYIRLTPYNQHVMWHAPKTPNVFFGDYFTKGFQTKFSFEDFMVIYYYTFLICLQKTNYTSKKKCSPKVFQKYL